MKELDMIDAPRNHKILDVELNWAKLNTPTSPFGTPQYELQIATTDKAVAEDLKANYFNVKEKDGKFVVSLKRKAQKADGSDNGAPRVVDAKLAPFTGNIGNGSRGNVIVWQYPYEAMGRKGVASSLTAVQIVDLVEYTGGSSVDFEAIDTASAEEPTPASAADLF